MQSLLEVRWRQVKFGSGSEDLPKDPSSTPAKSKLSQVKFGSTLKPKKISNPTAAVINAVTKNLFRHLDKDTRSFILDLAKWAALHKTIRLYYGPKVTTGRQVYRTIHPYSLRVRTIHTDGKFPDNYKNPPRPVIVLFGYDPYEKTIKMFVVNRVKNFEYRGNEFTPRWPVEFEGIKESVGDFKGKVYILEDLPCQN